jgi:spoIIIJ-associated protein
LYDPRSEAKEFIGASRSEAVANACNFYDVQEDELKFSELDPEEVHGLGARVVVVAVPPNAGRPSGRPERGAGESRGARRGGREASGPRERPRQEKRPSPQRRSPERERPSAEPSVGSASTDLSAEGEFVLGLVERMDVGPFEVAETVEENLRAFVLRGEGARRLSEGDSRGVEAVQLLANQAALRIGGDDARKVVVDAEGDSDRREELLERVAERAASRAEKTGRTISLDPMNPRDRRIVHVALRDSEDVATLSQGSGRYRRVLVVPKGAPEFEEARQSATSSAREED